MSEPLTLRYHAQACRLLGLVPELDPDAVRLIEDFEASGLRLPDAVREWYSLRGVEDALAAHDRACGPAALADVVSSTRRARQGEHRRAEIFGPWDVNTGYSADVTLNGEADPPVYIDPEAREVPFSHFILDTAWWRVAFDDQPIEHIGRDYRGYKAVFGPPHLDFMGEHFEELPREVNPNFNFSYPPRPAPFEHRTFRFFRPGWRVEVVVEGGDPAVGFRPAGYSLAADTREEVRALEEFVWPCRHLLHGAG